jgi:hypothetical protein
MMMGDAGVAPAAGNLFGFSVARTVAASTPDALDRTPGTPSASVGGQSFVVARHALTADTLMARFTSEVYEQMTGFTLKAVLTSFDRRLTDLSGRAVGRDSACLTAAVAPSPLLMPDGLSVDMYAQCHDGEPGATNNFVIFGRAPDGSHTVYERSSAGTRFVRARETEAGSGRYELAGYFSVFPQADGSGSALVVHLEASEDARTIKWTGAYNTRICGISYFADENHVFLRGSANDDNQGGSGCAAELSAVYSALDLSVDGATAFDETQIFSGAEFIRRVSSTLPAVGGGSGVDTIEAYPGGGNVLLTRGSPATADLTDLNFGPDVVDALGSSAF